MPTNNKPTIGLVVPFLAAGSCGGLQSVASFIKNTIQRSDRYNLKLISPADSFKDSCNLRLTKPFTWIRGVTTSVGVWEDHPFIHVGSIASEFEFQRYLPRKALTEAVADCDILQVVSGSPALANSVCGLGKPVALQVATRAKIERNVRDSNPRSLTDWWRKGMTEITDKLDDIALCKVDAVQVENPWMLNYVKQLTKDNSCIDLRYAPPGVNAHKFHPLLERSLNDDAYILCVCRLNDPRKNIFLLLESYALLPQDIKDRVRLVFAGASEPPQKFVERANSLGLNNRINYILKPESKKLVELYRQATLFALTSDEEGLGVVLLEAMACGVPVISTRSGGPDGIITDGKDGYLVPLNNSEILANRLLILCTNIELNLKMGKLARQTIEERYTEEITGEIFVNMWDKMLINRKIKLS